MIRVALIGDSHLSNWKRAWDLIANNHPGVELVFFGAAGTRLACCAPRSDRLVFEDDDVARTVEATSGGHREVVAADYDAICIIGLRFGVRVMTDLYPRWRTDSHQGKEGSFHLVSDACFFDTLSDRLKDSPAMLLVHKLRSITDKLILMAVQPAISEAMLTLPDRQPGLRLAMAAGDDNSLKATFRDACRHLESSNLIILDQPEETLASPLLSKDMFRRESEGELDWAHMNDAFGELALRDLLSHLHLHFGAMPDDRAGQKRDEHVAEIDKDRAGTPSLWGKLKRSLGSTSFPPSRRQ